MAKFLGANGFSVTQKPKLKDFTLHEDVLPSRETLTKAVNAEDLRAKTAILLLASSGMRASELVALRLGDIDIEHSPSLVRVFYSVGSRVISSISPIPAVIINLGRHLELLPESN